MIFFLLVAVVALVVISPYITVVYKRKKMISRITDIASKSGFRVRSLHKFVCFSFNRGKKYDLLFECKTHAYAVKLWSATKKNSTLIVKNGRISESVIIPDEIVADERKRRIDGNFKRVPVTQNNFKLRRGKPVLFILLIYPPNREIISVEKTTRKKLDFGDKLFDKTIYYPANFERLFKNIEKPDLQLKENQALSNNQTV